MGARAASDAAERIRGALAARGAARIIVATGASQFTVLGRLVEEPAIDWPKVEVFHLDEYIGLAADHPASFRRYLHERFVDRLPVGAFYAIDGEAPAEAECRRLGELIERQPIDVALVGIGENGHLAFNDPPADFETQTPFLRVALDEACRRQQWGEGWFPRLDDVPREAITMSIAQIMKSRAIVCSVPDERKAAAVKASVEGPVSPLVPASILQRHAAATLLLDGPAASLLGARR
jgi:glucosamine-6-phosphate deaminase